MKRKRRSIILLLLTLTVSVSAADKQKIILDCDLGGDIDDAFAVALVLTSPEFEVLGLVDVVVTDGFTGNVFIKGAEGVASMIHSR